MDITETYIKMCERADEMQVLHYWKTGDFSSNSSVPIFCQRCINEYSGMIPDGEAKGDVWLPRQDQLQEMVRKHEERLFLRFRRWWGSLVERDDKYPDFNSMSNEHLDYDSFEQLWLAFVMKENFNKVWDGSDWKAEAKEDVLSVEYIEAAAQALDDAPVPTKGRLWWNPDTDKPELIRSREVPDAKR